MTAVFERIAISPQVRFGKPCVAGTRIAVGEVLELVEQGIAFAEIVRDYYPDISIDDVRECVRYAIATVNAEEIHLRAA